MSKQLEELLFLIRQHPAFAELLQGPGVPEPKEFSPSKGNSVEQFTEHVFRSGRRLQDTNWRQLLIGEPTSDKEKS